MECRAERTRVALSVLVKMAKAWVRRVERCRVWRGSSGPLDSLRSLARVRRCDSRDEGRSGRLRLRM